MNFLHAALAVALAWAATPALAGTPDGATIARQGNGHGAAPCAACHGADGGGQAAAGFPRLAGLPAAYLRKQLDDFANGTRTNATMQPVASALSDAERAAVSTYFAALPVPASGAAPEPTGTAAMLGRTLATRGRWTDGLPGCEQCHGPGGIGVGDHFPPLVGQSAVYITNQLQAWKQGARHNDNLQLMRSVSAKLSDADMAAISAWFAAQPQAHTEIRQP